MTRRIQFQGLEPSQIGKNGIIPRFEANVSIPVVDFSERNCFQFFSIFEPLFAKEDEEYENSLIAHEPLEAHGGGRSAELVSRCGIAALSRNSEVFVIACSKLRTNLT